MNTNPFKIGDQVTVIYIDTMLAMTHRNEITVTATLSEPVDLGYNNETRRYGTCKRRGKRKEFYLQAERECSIFLRGWDLPLTVDTDGHGGIMRGNACFNFVGDEDKIRTTLALCAVVAITDEQRASLVLCTGESERLLYPEIRTPHAVVNRMKEKQAA